MNINRRKILLTGGTFLAFLMIGVAVLPVAGQDHFGKARGRIGMARLSGVRSFIGNLNLTTDQKAQIKSILTNNKPQILQAARDVVKARLDVINGVPNAGTELANARSHAADLRKQIFEQIKPVLTADQLSRVQERKQLRTQRLQNLLDRLNKKISG